MNQLFDRNVIIKSKNKAFENWQDYNFLFNMVADILYEKINELKENFNNIIFLSSDCFELLNKEKLKFKKMVLVSEYIELLKLTPDSKKHIFRVNCNFENLCLRKENFDLLITNLCLHKINDVKNFSSSLLTFLEKKGLLVCTYFGNKSLIELRNSFIIADDCLRQSTHQRIIPLIDMIDATTIFQKAGFSEIVADSTTIKIKYKSLEKLLNDIRGMGENNCLTRRYKGLFSKHYLEETERIYKEKFSDESGDLIVTCDIVTLVMWKN